MPSNNPMGYYGRKEQEEIERERKEAQAIERYLQEERKNTEHLRQQLSQEIKEADQLIKITRQLQKEVQRLEGLIGGQHRLSEKIIHESYKQQPDHNIIQKELERLAPFDKEIQTLFGHIQSGLQTLWNVNRQFSMEEKLEKELIVMINKEAEQINTQLAILNSEHKKYSELITNIKQQMQQLNQQQERRPVGFGK